MQGQSHISLMLLFSTLEALFMKGKLSIELKLGIFSSLCI
jgi:hypothetical protein